MSNKYWTDKIDKTAEIEGDIIKADDFNKAFDMIALDIANMSPVLPENVVTTDKANVANGYVALDSNGNIKVASGATISNPESHKGNGSIEFGEFGIEITDALGDALYFSTVGIDLSCKNSGSQNRTSYRLINYDKQLPAWSNKDLFEDLKFLYEKIKKVDSELSDESENAIQNKAVAAALKLNQDEIDELKEDLGNIEQNLGEVTLFNPFSRYGNFESSSDWYCTDGTISVADNVATFSVNSIYAGIRPVLSPSEEYKTNLIKDHMYYFFATIKSQKSNAVLSFNVGGGLGGAGTKGTGDWEFVDKLEKATHNDIQPYSVTDNNSEYGSTISVKHMGYVDLTECYGAGNEPDYDTMHAILIKNNYWIDEKTSVFPNIPEKISKLENDVTELKILPEKISKLENDVTELKILPEKISKCKVFIFGDSITATNYIGDDGSLTNVGTNWPTYAMTELGVTDWYNFAKDGSTYHDVPNSSDYQTFYKQFGLAKSTGITPDIIIVSYGTNDYQHPNTDTYESVMNVQNLDNLDRTNLHGALRYCYWALREKYPSAVIFVGTPIQRPDTLIYTKFRQAIIEMANTYCLHIIDAGTESGICKQFETWGGSGRYLKDGLHPNEEGKKLLGHYYANSIRNKF